MINNTTLLEVKNDKLIETPISTIKIPCKGSEYLFVTIDDKTFINPLFEYIEHNNEIYISFLFKNKMFLISETKIYQLKNMGVIKVKEIFIPFVVPLIKFIQIYDDSEDIFKNSNHAVTSPINYNKFKCIPVVTAVQYSTTTIFELFPENYNVNELILFTLSEEDYFYAEHYFKKFNIIGSEKLFLELNKL